MTVWGAARLQGDTRLTLATSRAWQNSLVWLTGPGRTWASSAPCLHSPGWNGTQLCEAHHCLQHWRGCGWQDVVNWLSCLAQWSQ